MTIRVEYQLCNMGEPTGDSPVVREFENAAKRWEWEESQAGHPFLHYEVRSVVEPKSTLADVRAKLKAQLDTPGMDVYSSYKAERNRMFGPIGDRYAGVFNSILGDKAADARKAGILEAADVLQAEVDSTVASFNELGLTEKEIASSQRVMQAWVDKIRELVSK